jgi:transcriptional regulator with XRE-family HTH domain
MTIPFNCHNGWVAYAVSMSFGQRLKDRRADLRMTGTDLGNRMDPPVSKQTIAHWEGDRYKPQVDQIAQLCDILNVSADALVRGSTQALSPAAQRLAIDYDALTEIERAQWDLILRAMPKGGKTPVSQIAKTDGKSGKPANLSVHGDTTMVQSASAEKQLGPALRDALITGTGAKDAGRKPTKVSKQRAGRRA